MRIIHCILCITLSQFGICNFESLVFHIIVGVVIAYFMLICAIVCVLFFDARLPFGVIFISLCGAVYGGFSAANLFLLKEMGECLSTRFGHSCRLFLQ